METPKSNRSHVLISLWEKGVGEKEVNKKVKIKNSLMAGLFALGLVGIPFWYFITTFYPQYVNNYLYLGIGGVVLVLIAAFGAKYAVRKG